MKPSYDQWIYLRAVDWLVGPSYYKNSLIFIFQAYEQEWYYPMDYLWPVNPFMLHELAII